MLQVLLRLTVVLFVSNSSIAQSIYQGHSLVESTYLIELAQDTTTSLKARELRTGGFETAEGAYVDFSRWYSPDWYDTRISWMTQITPKFGLIWGIGTGEHAEKYSIDPSLRLGFIYQTNIGKNSTVAFTASTYVGGELRERTCQADYGEIGGVQEVNCRLAATTLSPEETLDYLTYSRPGDVWQITYKFNF
jgi:hypothetical protein